ncbi:MAG: BatD family protein [Epsilonproteobacteria bacterium]|nr:BatD family protein [Campylobacterota bacterium]
MKKSLGSIIIFLLFTSNLLATTLASYTLKSNKPNPYQKEAVLITFEARQIDHTDNMFFLLHPKPSDSYLIQLLQKDLNDKRNHDTEATFSFLLFPLKSGDISVDFDFVVQTASDSAVAQSYVDDHDNNTGIQKKTAKLPINPLILHIKPIAKDVVLVGDFSLKEKMGQTNITQYESTNITYTLSGKGFVEQNLSLIKNIQDVSLFFEKNDLLHKATQQGYTINSEFIYALSSKKSFTIPEISLKAFSPKTGKYYHLTAPKHHIAVKQIDTTLLLDPKESPTTKHFVSIKSLKQYLIYIAIFISGFISAKLTTLHLQPKQKSKEYKQIQTAQEAKQLLMHLINYQLEQTFSAEIKQLEEMVYHDKKGNFGKIKKTILKRLS